MKLIRVTSALKCLSNFDGIPPAVLAEAAERGTEFHAFAAGYAMTGWVPDIPDRIQGFFQSFRTWFDKYTSHIFWIEKELTDETFGIVGHADAGLRLVDGRNVVVDWKTAAVSQLSWGPQTAAYLKMTDKCCDEEYSEGMVLQPKKDGSIAKATVYKKSESDRYWAIFISALNIERYKESCK